MSSTTPSALDDASLLKPLYNDLIKDDRVREVTVKRGKESDAVVFHVHTIDDIAEFGVKSDYLGFPNDPADDDFTDDSVVTSPHKSAARSYPEFPVFIFNSSVTK
jgi:hypothetical protein